MSRTTFSGPVKSDNGFEGDISATIGTVATLACTTLVIGSSILTTGSVASGVVGSTQLGYLPVKIGATTKYIPLYTSLTL
jgi:hypothetical protein